MAMSHQHPSALFTDYYELTMMAGYAHAGIADVPVTFDFFFRRLPFGVDLLITAGQGEALRFLESLAFTEDELAYLETTSLPNGFVRDYLTDMRFTGDVWAMPEGTVAYANEPVLRIHAPLAQAQLIETAMINTMCYSTLVASNAAQVRRVSGGASILEFGARRAHGPDGAFTASRAAYLGGCDATSNVESAKYYDMPVAGTQAHAWVMAFEREIDSFEAFARTFPDDCVLLVDTYDTLGSGVPNAIKVGHAMRERGQALKGIRLDSGDLAALSKAARAMLDAADLPDVKIVASGDLDAERIAALRKAGAPIDSYGVGTSLVTAKQDPTIAGVYKMAEIEDMPVAKISDTPAKTSNPGRKQVWRSPDGDVIGLEGEKHAGEPLLVKMMEGGKIIVDLPHVEASKARATDQQAWLAQHGADGLGASWPVRRSAGLEALRNKVLRERG